VRPDRVASLFTDEDGKIECVGCQEVLTMERIAGMTRVSPSEPFSAWCPQCLRRLCECARRAMDADAFVSAFFKVSP
jgi:hypothetical protein